MSPVKDALDALAMPALSAPQIGHIEPPAASISPLLALEESLTKAPMPGTSTTLVGATGNPSPEEMDVGKSQQHKQPATAANADTNVIVIDDNSSDFIDAASGNQAGKQKLLSQAKQDEKEKAGKPIAQTSSTEEGLKTDTESVDEKTVDQSTTPVQHICAKLLHSCMQADLLPTVFVHQLRQYVILHILRQKDVIPGE